MTLTAGGSHKGRPLFIESQTQIMNAAPVRSLACNFRRAQKT